jgi:ABC-type multidrug transport system permease subunit
MPRNIEHVHPLDEGDSRGLAPIYLVIAWIFGGYFGATVLTTLRGTAYRDRSHALARLGLLVAYSILSGVLGALIAGPIIGAFPDGHFWSVSASGTLIVFAVGAITMALQLLLGVVGTLIAILAFVILGNPSSGGIVPGELLPAFWRETGPWLPNAPGYVLIRNILYFDGNAIGRSLIVLAVYAIVGVAILLIFADRRRPGILPRDPEAELAAAAAAAG